MDFVLGQLADGSRVRTLIVVDVYTRECLAINVGPRLTVENVAEHLDRIKHERGVPRSKFCDNESEIVSSSIDLWAYVNGVRLDFSRLGKPTDNAVIESFNGLFRGKGLNTHWFTSMDDAERKIEDWRQEYNASLPHRALKRPTPLGFSTRTVTGGAGS